MRKKSNAFSISGAVVVWALWGAAAATAQETPAETYGPPAAPAPEAELVPEALPPARSITVLRALDKITARISEIEAPDNGPIRFGSLSIRARTCRSEPPEEKPETYAFLEIDDIDKSGQSHRVFTGWMLASSPALHPLEHPVYDVWVISCRMADGGLS